MSGIFILYWGLCTQLFFAPSQDCMRRSQAIQLQRLVKSIEFILVNTSTTGTQLVRVQSLNLLPCPHNPHQYTLRLVGELLYAPQDHHWTFRKKTYDDNLNILSSYGIQAQGVETLAFLTGFEAIQSAYRPSYPSPKQVKVPAYTKWYEAHFEK